MNSKEKGLARKIQLLLSDAFLTEMENPFFKTVSISRVEIINGGEIAKVFISSFSDKPKPEILKECQKTSSFFSRMVATNLQMRKAPKIIFALDEDLDAINRIEEIISKG